MSENQYKIRFPTKRGENIACLSYEEFISSTLRCIGEGGERDNIHGRDTTYVFKFGIIFFFSEKKVDMDWATDFFLEITFFIPNLSTPIAA